MIAAMTPASVRWAVLLLVLLWVLAGPVGMVFAGCGMCDGLCVTCSCAPRAPEAMSSLPFMAGVAVPLAASWSGAPVRVLEPPPKSLLSA